MPGDNPLIQAPKTTLHCLQSTSHVQHLVHQYLHMHQDTHPHAFAPILHQSLTIHPAPMGPHDRKFNMHLPGETTKASFAPFSAFHRATQKSFTSRKPGRWGALHVCIAWRIYYHEQLKKIQQKSTRLHRKLTSEHPVTSPPDSVQQKDSDQPSRRHPDLDSPCGHSGKAAENLTHFNRSYLSELDTSSSSSCHSRKTDREKLELPQNLRWRERPNEKEKHGSQQTDRAKDLPLRDKSWDLTVIPELDSRHGGSLDRKRLHECDSFIGVKRVKQENAEDLFDPSHIHPSSHTGPVHHVNICDLSALRPPSSRCNVTTAPAGLVCYPGAKIHPYKTALELHSTQNAPKDYSVSTWKAITMPVVAQRQKEDFHGVITRPFYLPVALRQQETVYLRGREFLHSRHENCQLHRGRPQLTRPDFLTASYLGP